MKVTFQKYFAETIIGTIIPKNQPSIISGQLTGPKYESALDIAANSSWQL
jgi:hypothetical protein